MGIRGGGDLGMWLRMVLCASIGLGTTAVARCADHESEHSEIVQGTAHSTRAPHGLERFFESGITWGAGLTQVYQQNAHGGLSTSRRSGRYSGSYDIEVSADLETVSGMADSTIYMLLEGGGPEAGGIDPAAVGSYFGVNTDAIEEEWIDVSELWFLRSFDNDRLFVQVGKADLTAGIEYRGVVSAFDLNRYANDEHSQFLNTSLVNNPTIPFPLYTLALSAVAKPWDQWQFAVAGAMQGGDPDIDEVASWASDDEGLFFIFQTSFLPSAGTSHGSWAREYHAGVWWTGGGDLTSQDERKGVYVSASRELFRADDDPQSERGLGLFTRLGWTDGEAAELDTFWSVGLQYHGLLQSRADDVLGIGFADGWFTEMENPGGLGGNERIVEMYYSMAVAPWLSLSPDIQYIADPGGNTGADDAFVVGLRARILIE